MKPLETQPADFVERAPVRIVVTRDIPASPDEIFAVLADHESWPKWFTSLRAVEVLGPAEGVGARRRVILPGLTVDEEFVSWEPGKRFGFTVTHLNRRMVSSMNEDMRLEDLGDGRTRFTYTVGIRPTSVSRLIMPVFTRGFRQGIERGLAGLEKHLAGA